MIGLYLGHSDIGQSYGAAGPLVILLVWIYYSSQAFFLGAEFTQVYANDFGSRLGGEGWEGEDALSARPESAISPRETTGSAPKPALPSSSAVLPVPAPRPQERIHPRHPGWGTAALGAGLGFAVVLLARRVFR